MNGEHISSYFSDVDSDGAFIPDTEVVENGILKECYYRSAPYFYIVIDGINILE